MRFLVLIISVLCMALGSYAQVKKKKKPVAPKKQETVAQLVEDFFSKEITYDSTKQAAADSLAFIIAEKQVAKRDSIYQHYLNPSDAWMAVDGKMEMLLDVQGNLSIDTVINKVRSHFNTTLERARAMFYLVSRRIEYDDIAFAANAVKPIVDPEQDALETFTQKKGVCQNYANLFAYLCQALDIECEVVIGWGRNFPYGVTVEENDTNHAWNAFKSGNRWILVDATWAHEIYGQQIERYWFDPDPNEFVYSHLPADSKWQMRKQIMDFETFKNAPIIHASFFTSKLKFELPEYGNLISENGQFSIGLPIAQKSYRFNFSVASYKGNGRLDCKEVAWQSIPRTIVTDKKTGTKNFQIKLPGKGIWWVKISVIRTVPEQEVGEVTYRDALFFRLRY